MSNEDVVVKAKAEVKMFVNRNGGVTILQVDGDVDRMVAIDAEDIQAVIDALERLQVQVTNLPVSDSNAKSNS